MPSIEVKRENGNTDIFITYPEGGLWKGSRQLQGTSQFQAKTPAILMRKLKKMFQPEKIKMIRGSADDGFCGYW